MANYAIIDNNVVTDICLNADPKDRYHPDLAKLFVEVPDNVRGGWKKTGDNTFEAPVPQPIDYPPGDGYKVMPNDQKILKAEFMVAMTKDERKAWKAKVGSDTLIDSIEEEWSLGVEVWFGTKNADNPYKGAMADLKTKGVIGDATIAKLTTKYYLDNENLNDPIPES